MSEIWKDIKGYEGFYQVSSFGNVRSVDRICSSGQPRKGKMLKIDYSPYAHLTLSKDGKTKNHNVHRLVAEAFIPNPNGLPCINHKDEDKTNNRVDNLEWCTYAYNNDYSGVVQKATDAKCGKPLSKEHREKLSMLLKKSGKERSAKRMKTMRERYPNGIEFTDEQRERISNALKGKVRSEATKQKMKHPKSEEHKEHMREAQRLSHKARKLGMTYKEYKKMLEGEHLASDIQ